jgi:ribosomal protein L37AE/L43A
MDKALFNHLKKQIAEHEKAVDWHNQEIKKIERKILKSNSCLKCGSEKKEQFYGTEMSTVWFCPRCD